MYGTGGCLTYNGASYISLIGKNTGVEPDTNMGYRWRREVMETECYLVCDPYSGWSVFWFDQLTYKKVVTAKRQTLQEAIRDAAISLGTPVCIKIMRPPP